MFTTEDRALRSVIDNDTVREDVNLFLDTLFARRIHEAEAIDVEYAALWNAIRRLAAAGGKRLRPYMVVLGSSMQAPRDTGWVLPAAAAQELLHLAMLVHDDIIDRDTIRYGIKNVSGQYDESYGPDVADSLERRHFSDSAALLAGDLLIAEAYTVLHQCEVKEAAILRAQVILSQSIFRVVGGELLDTESAFRPIEQVNVQTIAEQKTASYSFIGPLVMGATLAGEPASTIEQLRAFGKTLGVAFQLKDDLLGVFGDETVTGKSASTDIREGKHTHLIEQFYQLGNAEQKVAFKAVFRKSAASDGELDEARRLLIDSGAKAAVEARIQSHIEEATTILRDIPMHETARASFMYLMELTIIREK